MAVNNQRGLAGSQEEGESLQMYGKAVFALEHKAGLWEWELLELMTDGWGLARWRDQR